MDAGRELSLFGFIIGIIVASFQESGSDPCFHELFIRFKRVSIDSGGNCFKIL